MALLPLKSCAQAEKKEHDRRMKERAQAVGRTGNKKPSSETLSNHNMEVPKMGIPTNHPSN